MAYDEQLADRVRAILQDRPDITERRMMGGLAFLCRGRMCGGVLGRDLVVRVGRDEMEAALRRPHVRSMDFTGRPLAGFAYVAPEGVRRTASLQAWLDRGLAVAATQGPKKAAKAVRGSARSRRRA
jgi:TfoX/Sxy family transcriptional regulator of competence genes